MTGEVVIPDFWAGVFVGASGVALFIVGLAIQQYRKRPKGRTLPR